MLTTVVVLLGIAAAVQQRTLRDPVLGQDALSARAAEIVRELGHELPTFTASSLEVNDEFRKFVARAEPPDWAAVDRDCPVLYRYWRRWSASPLQAEEFHGPTTTLADPRARPPGSITVVVDSAGNLIELDVIPSLELPGKKTEPEPEPDWAKALRLGGVEKVERQPVEPSRAVPTYCDSVEAWRINRPLEDGGAFVFHAGAHHGRIVHVTTAWDWDLEGPISRALSQQVGPRQNDLLPALFLIAMSMLAVLLAWHNLRLGRGDLRGAMVCAFAVGGGYLLFEVTGLPLHEYTFASLLGELSMGRVIGHPLVHAVTALLAYLAVEPYVRRIWPRSLIGWARLSQGRIRDPAVGGELLTGVFVALAFGGLLLAIDLAERWFGLQGHDPVRLHPEVMGNSARLGMFLAGIPGIITLWTIYPYLFLAVVRLVTRRDWVSMVIAVVLFTAVQNAAGLLTGPFEWSLLWRDVAPTLLGNLLSVLLLVRVGLIAGIMMEFAGQASDLVPLTLALSAPYAPQALLGMGVIVLPALYGFWVSLGGQPLFKDPLLTEKPARA
jgi:hypothetical protein